MPGAFCYGFPGNIHRAGNVPAGGFQGASFSLEPSLCVTLPESITLYGHAWGWKTKGSGVENRTPSTVSSLLFPLRGIGVEPRVRLDLGHAKKGPAGLFPAGPFHLSQVTESNRRFLPPRGACWTLPVIRRLRRGAPPPADMEGPRTVTPTRETQ